MSPITQALRSPKHGSGALVAYLVAGYPDREAFRALLHRVATVADVIEVGVPFTDPMADGVSIQQASHAALQQGVDLPWILQTVAGCPVPVALMGYLNPFLAFGDGLPQALVQADVSALIVPDCPLHERHILGEVPQVQLVTPLTEPGRMADLCEASSGFVYAVTRTGITGTALDSEREGLSSYLGRVRNATALPVMAGFGVRAATDVQRLSPHCDGVIVGSALVDVLARGDDPVAFLHQLMGGSPPERENSVTGSQEAP
ncbi:MAG: tryptophan synthase subunit alpha [Myxococcales bacterium]|nr:tryptophan synthase subunit alpha [Myxococcales bacterium]